MRCELGPLSRTSCPSFGPGALEWAWSGLARSPSALATVRIYATRLTACARVLAQRGGRRASDTYAALAHAAASTGTGTAKVSDSLSCCFGTCARVHYRAPGLRAGHWQHADSMAPWRPMLPPCTGSENPGTAVPKQSGDLPQRTQLLQPLPPRTCCA